MSADKKSDAADGSKTIPKKERVSLEEYKRLIREAQQRGEDTAPLLKQLVLQTIDEVEDGLDTA